MKESAQKQFVDMFARTEHLESKKIPVKIKSLIAYTVAPLYLFAECLASSGLSNSSNPVDGLLITLVTRMHKIASGTLSLLALGRLQEAEILSRTVMESALSLQYLAEENSSTRLVQYFEHYLELEREQNRKWQKELAGLSDEWRSNQEARIKNKNEALDNTALFIEHFCESIGVKYPIEKGYPNFLGICTVLNKAIDYRTVYSAMCSQAHHDAEDILNDLIVGTSLNERKLSMQLDREKNNFSIFLVLHGVRYYLECMGKVGAKYRFSSVAQQASSSYTSISCLMSEVSSGGFVGNATQGWMPN